MADPALVALLEKMFAWSPAAAFAYVVIFGGYKQWWCYGWQLRAMTEDRDRYRNIVLRMQNVAEAAIQKVAP